MEMCYNEDLVMPSNYVVMDNNEMEYVDGGRKLPSVQDICAIIGAAIALGGASYAMGQAVGERIYYAGVTSKSTWGLFKVPATAAAVLAGGALLGPIFMLGLENKLYSMF